jgi:hypothetical protein
MITKVPLLAALVGAVLAGAVALIAAPVAHADPNEYLTCLASYGISGDANTELALCDEAYNTLRGRPRGQAASETRVLSQKYNLSEHVASTIVGCATTFPPV